MPQEPCIKHTLRLVTNHYDTQGNIDTDTFSSGEWRTEKACKNCDYTLNS